jgi:D-xylose transport system ATP-binding protein
MSTETVVAEKGAPLVEMHDISIAFGGIKAVDHASIDLHPGEVVGLLGHNGAGKSTLIKVLSGAYKRDSGTIRIDGKDADISNPRDAKAFGIETIYQTLALADNVDATANLYLGRELRTRWGTLDDIAMEAECRKVMGRLNPNFRRFKEPVKVAVGRPAPIGRHRPRHPFQRPHPDHGRADGGARPPGNRSGRRTDQAAQGPGHRHLPDQPRHP